MKKIYILILIMAVSSAMYSQKTTKETVSYTYTQLPLFPLPKYIKSYSIKTKLPYYGSPGTKTKRHMSIGKLYKNNKKNVPGKVVYDFVDKKNDYENRYLRLKSLQEKENGDISIILNVGFATITKEKKFERTVKGVLHYGYKYWFYVPVELIIEEKRNGKIIMKKQVMTKKDIYSIEHEKRTYISDSKGSYNPLIWNRVSQQIYIQASYLLKDIVPQLKQKKIYVYSAKKKYDYSELDRAQDLMTKAFTPTKNTFNKVEKGNLKEAIKIWKTALLKVDYSNKKAKINAKIASKLYLNCAYAYWVLNEFGKAKTAVNNAAKYKKTIKKANKLKKTIFDSEKRFNANN